MEQRADVDPSSLEVVRSEEELAVHTRVVPRERVRLVKRIVSETVTRTVEVRREELHVERYAVGPEEEDAGPAPDAQPIEIVLHEEEVVLSTRVVPRERVRVWTETVTEQRPVTEDLRREVVEVEEEGGV